MSSNPPHHSTFSLPDQRSHLTKENKLLSLNLQATNSLAPQTATSCPTCHSISSPLFSDRRRYRPSPPHYTTTPPSSAVDHPSRTSACHRIVVFGCSEPHPRATFSPCDTRVPSASTRKLHTPRGCALRCFCCLGEAGRD